VFGSFGDKRRSLELHVQVSLKDLILVERIDTDITNMPVPKLPLLRAIYVRLKIIITRACIKLSRLFCRFTAVEDIQS
jgi:hypothetical protein